MRIISLQTQNPEICYINLRAKLHGKYPSIVLHIGLVFRGKILSEKFEIFSSEKGNSFPVRVFPVCGGDTFFFSDEV